MPNYLMRIEGVNLGDFIFDNSDLNTIRGAGLLLLNAVKTSELESFNGIETVEPISLGASVGSVSYTHLRAPRD